MSGEKIKEYPRFHYGCDPELFLSSGGHIVGAERFIPREGLSGHNGIASNKAVLDGVQVELHPAPMACREQLGQCLASSFRTLKGHLKKHKYDAQVSFQGVVEVPKEELERLSAAARTLGCAPSQNIHGSPSIALSEITAEYRVRSAGGHIHIGLPKTKGVGYDSWKGTYKVPPAPDRDHFPADRLVPLLDILVGNTCVLLDRDPQQVERRKVYGRAGEYREPPHGIEYRTLSNFWLRSYPLMSLVMGLTRLAGAVIYANNTYDGSFETKLRSLVDIDQVQRAINENNLILARANYAKVREFIAENVAENTCKPEDHVLPLDPNTLREFDHFLSKPIHEWFPEDPFEYWCDLGTEIRPTKGEGWENFLLNVVRKDWVESRKDAIA
jgi:hypothetical protein